MANQTFRDYKADGHLWITLLQLDRMMHMTEPLPSPPTWKIVLAAILDFLTIFLVGGYIIGWASGEVSKEGFNLSGLSAIALLAVIVAYFVLGKRIFGGTLWKRVFGIKQ